MTFRPFLLLMVACPCLTASPQSAQKWEPEMEQGSAWRMDAQDHLRRAEYAFHPVAGEAGVWSAPNRSQELRSRVSREGLEVFSRATSADGAEAAWKLRLSTTSFGRVGAAGVLAGTTIEANGRRIELDHGGLTEWFENDERGIEQGWTIHARPGGVGPLWIGLEFDGDLSLRIDESARSGLLVDAHGEARLRYRDLVVYDARGRELVARLVPSPAGTGIAIEEEHAAYPLTVDPLLTGPAWTTECDQPFAYFGQSVATAGDVNGDGYSDVVVGAANFDNGQTDEGRAFVFHGSAAGLSTLPAWTAEGDQDGALFGGSVATAGDVNGDGYSDVVVGAPGVDNDQADEGRAFVYLGSASGLSPSPAWTAESDQTGSLFGVSVATASDVNGDGYSDVVVGAANFDDGQTDEGRAFVYLGSPTGLAPSPAWTAESDQASAFFGVSVATGGDVNGDGYGDVLVGAFSFENGQAEEGRAFAFLGSSTGLSTTPNWTAESDQMGAQFGLSVTTAGDVNGDGYGDVLVGARFFDNGQTDEGRAFVYLGSAFGLSTSPAWTAESDRANAALGASISTAGDVNGDGFSDVLVGDRTFANGQTDEGRALVFLGSAAGLSTSPAWTTESHQAGASFGVSVSTAGDVNGDGYSDVLVGASTFDNGQADEGRAYAYHGTATGLSLSPAWTKESDQASAFFGSSVAPAGDVNGDGFGDVIVGAYLFDHGQANEGRAFVYLGSSSGLSSTPAWMAEGNQLDAYFGWSVSAAGDVNGDGFGDVIVGAILVSNGHSNEGRVYLYLGSASGLSTGPAWTAEANKNFANLGWSVSTAGDVNGDGFSDVIVGAPAFENGHVSEGRAQAYLGSASGLASSPAWTAESDQASALFGSSVASAGDVNGDGYGDVIVGAHHFDNGQLDEGRAFVYLGSAAGLATGPAWTAETDQTFAEFGASVSSAGDLNGDGYGDVIVGVNAFDNGHAYAYFGSPSGLSTSPAWTAQSDQTSSFFGQAVSTAGDVNGDGYSDLIVGAYNYGNDPPSEGRAYVYLGSSSGPSTSPAWTAEGELPSTSFGATVAAAGDVNGDGYSDVIVGAPRFSNGQTSEGRVYVFTGHGGWLRALQQRKQSDLTPLAPLASTGKNGLFRIQGDFPKNLAAFSWASPAPPLAHLEWEIEPLGVAFDGLGIERGLLDEALVPTGGSVTFNELAGAGFLQPKLRDAKSTPYHWRARVATNNPLFPHTAWFTSPSFELRKPAHSP